MGGGGGVPLSQLQELVRPHERYVATQLFEALLGTVKIHIVAERIASTDTSHPGLVGIDLPWMEIKGAAAAPREGSTKSRYEESLRI